jgi:ferric-dicitrate binding protein FerR (iron transport regulator)
MLTQVRLKIAVAALVIASAPLAAASAQTISGCTPRTVDDPPRTVFDCAGGLSIASEAATQLGLSAPSAGQSEVLDVQSGAALFEFTPGGRIFQIRTPHAIASVRGTVYAVDVTPARTAIFVVRGRVLVTRREGHGSVTLQAGQGTQVAPGKRLIPRHWGKERIAALLGRLGR